MGDQKQQPYNQKERQTLKNLGRDMADPVAETPRSEEVLTIGPQEWTPVEREFKVRCLGQVRACRLPNGRELQEIMLSMVKETAGSTGDLKQIDQVEQMLKGLNSYNAHILSDWVSPPIKLEELYAQEVIWALQLVKEWEKRAGVTQFRSMVELSAPSNESMAEGGQKSGS